MFRGRVPEYRNRRRCIYPVHALLGIMAAAHLADAPRGQKDLEVFANSLSQGQLKALGVRRDTKTGRCPSPDQTTFSRMMSKVDADFVEEVLFEWQRRIRGPVPADGTVAIEGKQPKHAGGQNVVTAVATPSQHYLGCELVEDESNEIPAARKLIARHEWLSRHSKPDHFTTTDFRGVMAADHDRAAIAIVTSPDHASPSRILDFDPVDKGKLFHQGF